MCFAPGLCCQHSLETLKYQSVSYFFGSSVSGFGSIKFRGIYNKTNKSQAKKHGYTKQSVARLAKFGQYTVTALGVYEGDTRAVRAVARLFIDHAGAISQ